MLNVLAFVNSSTILFPWMFKWSQTIYSAVDWIHY